MAALLFLSLLGIVIVFPIRVSASDGSQVITIPQENDKQNYKELIEAGRYNEAIATCRKAIAATENDQQKAHYYKQLGDIYVLRDDMKKAAEEFIQALGLSNDFSEKEKVQMAIYISWGDRLDEAIKELKLILSKNPSNTDARTHLARTLSWAGKYDEAIKEAEIVLSEPLYRREALLVKADSLNWKGDEKAAIPIYRDILADGENFGARLGLTYALLSKGKTQEAKECYNKLTPIYPYQEKELNKITEIIDSETKHILSCGYNYYSDTDSNRYNKYWINYRFPLYKWQNTFGYQLSDAWDKTRDNYAHDLFAHTYIKLTETFGAGGGAGIAFRGDDIFRGDDNKASLVTWHLKADLDFLKGKAGAYVSRESMSETAALIDNSIGKTRIGGNISQNIYEKISLYASYDYSDFNDDNSAHELQFMPKYTLLTVNPIVAVAYRLRFVDYAKQSGGGYFDPGNFLSHQVSVSTYFEHNKFYFYIEPYFGHQSFERYDEKVSDWIGGGFGSFGWKFKKGITLEASAEGGNFALGTVSGFNYYLVGVNLTIPL